jgi:hypothetical protein
LRRWRSVCSRPCPPKATAAANTGLGFAAWLMIGVPLVIALLAFGLSDAL